MTVETFQAEINGRVFSYTQMPATKSILLKLRLGKILGSGIPYIVESLGKPDAYQFTLFLKTIEKVMFNNDPEAVFGIIKDIADMVFVDGKKCNFDVDFTGCTPDLYKVIFWVLKKEYESFFGSLVKSKAPQEQKEQSNSMATSPE